MIDLKRKTVKVIAKSSQNLAQVVANTSFEFWERKDFRLYTNFETLDRTEQDRMFNELEVSVLSLFELQLEHVDTSTKDEQKLVFSALQKDLPAAFLQIMSDAGVEKKYLDVWQKLIDMRLSEYRNDFQTAINESQKLPAFKKGEEELRNAWARIETITIDCLRHLRRGKVEKDDPLWKLIRKWLISLDAQLTPIVKL